MMVEELKSLNMNDGQDDRLEMNPELCGLSTDIDLVKWIKVARLRWLGHVNRMEKDELPRKVFKDIGYIFPIIYIKV